MKLEAGFVAVVCLVSSQLGFAGDLVPDCMDRVRVLPVNNGQVLEWKKTTANQFSARGHILGTIRYVYPDHSSHHHFEVLIGDHSEDTIEVIYNEDFGPNPKPYIGMKIEACGDYITSFKNSGPYPASPDGAILHWVHRSPSPTRHPSGYMAMDGVLCGQGATAKYE